MFKLLKNLHCFTPFDVGKKDIFVAFDKICLIEDEININKQIHVEIFDCSELIGMPGFIDQHVHIAGGGGEQGPHSRTPEIMLGDIIKAGVTTVVGVLGFDSVTRSISGLLAKAKALENEGLTTYIYTGSYGVPTATLTGKVLTDIALIDKVVGVGEIAISDHRSSHPSLESLREVAVEARSGGMLGGKAGIVHIHVGDGKEGLHPLFQVLKESDFPLEMFVPTHINRNQNLFEQGLEFLHMGGNIDLTAGEKKGLSVPDALAKVVENGIYLDQVTVTSDGNGSIPGESAKPLIGQVEALFKDFCQAARNGRIPFEELLKTVTVNPAKILKIFPRKGTLAPGSDADILIMRKDNLEIEMLLAQGAFFIKNREIVKRGTYEN